MDAVSKIGRSLRFVPRMINSLRSVTPSALSSLRLLIRTSPLSTATPDSTIKPTPAEMLKGMQPGLQQQAQDLMGDMDEVDAKVQEKVEGLLGEQAGEALGKLQEHKRAAMLFRLGR